MYLKLQQMSLDIERSSTRTSFLARLAATYRASAAGFCSLQPGKGNLLCKVAFELRFSICFQRISKILLVEVSNMYSSTDMVGKSASEADFFGLFVLVWYENTGS